MFFSFSSAGAHHFGASRPYIGARTKANRAPHKNYSLLMLKLGRKRRKTSAPHANSGWHAIC
jgi:hypothetical protein